MSLFESLIDFIAPPDCMGCGSEGVSLCLDCRGELEQYPPRCFRCAVYVAEGALCPDCAHRLPYKALYIATTYSGLSKKLVRGLKFEYERPAAEAMAYSIWEEMLDSAFDADVLVPLPTATSRVRQRGFDHTLLLARHLAQHCGLPTKTVLRRMGQSRQVGMDRQSRLQLSESAFHVTNNANIRGASILLVDDVMTTGATLRAAAKALRQAGARRVACAVFAHKP